MMPNKSIIFITTRPPLQGGKGDQIEAYNKINICVNAGFDVEVLCMCKKPTSFTASSLNVNKITFLNFNYLFQIFFILYYIAVGFPCQIALFKNPFLMLKINNILKSTKPSALVIVTARSAANLPLVNCIPNIVTYLIDSLSFNFSRKVSRSFFLKLLFDFESRRMKEYELKLCDISRSCIVVSDFDKNYLGHANISVLPLSVPFRDNLIAPLITYPYSIVFSGNLSYEPNVTAILWFLKNCYQEIKKQVPHVKLHIIGRNPHEAIKSINDSSVLVVGEVNSIIDYVSKCNVAIAPMQSGSGMQFKILEAMESGLPVVTTTLGLGSISASNGQDVLLSDTPESFIQNVVMLLENTLCAKEIGMNARKYIREFHSPEIISNRFLQFLKV